MAVPTKMLDEVQDIMSSKQGINQQVEQVVQLLESYGMAHRMTILPSQLLCHPDNRGGAMVSFHDVWQKGLQMVQVGLQKTLLQDAIGIELAKAEDKKAMQIQQNKIGGSIHGPSCTSHRKRTSLGMFYYLFISYFATSIFSNISFWSCFIAFYFATFQAT